MIPRHARLHGLWLLLLISTAGAKTAWIQSRPFHQGSTILYANDRFTLHPYSLSEAYQSSNGLAWTSDRDTSLPSSASADRVVFLQGRYYAFSVSDGESFRTSTDGLHWTKQSLPDPCSFSDMTWGQGTFVGISACSDSLVATSPDGTQWTQHRTGNAFGWDRICYGNGVFVAMNHMGPISVSSDGSAWKVVQPNYYSGELRRNGDIRFGNGRFVIVGDGGRILTSTDGSVWTETFPIDQNGAFYSMLFEEGQFVVIGNGGGGVGFRSRDGLTWSKVSGYAYGTASLAYGNGRYLAITDGGTAYSDDSAATWKFSPAPKNSLLYGAAYTGQAFIVAGQNGALATSPDGLNWTERDAEVATDLTGAVWGNNRAIVSGTGGTILTSTDLAQWHKLIDPRLDFGSMTFGGSVFVGITLSGKIFASTDGAAWDSVYAAPAGQKLGHVAYGNGIFLVGDATNPGTLLRSADGRQWAPIQSDAIRKTLGGFLVYGIDGFLIGETRGAMDTLYRTTDGSDVRPVKISIPAVDMASPFDGPMAYGQGYYMTTTYSNSNGMLVYSTDGINWQVDQSDRDQSHGITFGGGKILRLANTVVGAVSVTSRFDPTPTALPPMRRRDSLRNDGNPVMGMVDAAGKARNGNAKPAHGKFFIRNR